MDYSKVIDKIISSKRILITGEVNSGKSKFLEESIKTLQTQYPKTKIGGIINKGLWSNRTKVAYITHNISNDEEFIFAVKEGCSPESVKKSLNLLNPGIKYTILMEDTFSFGQWQFLMQSFEKAKKTITKAIEQKNNIVIIDEFGPMEINGSGFRKEVDTAINTGLHTLILTCRKSLVDDIKNIYGEFEIIEISKK